MILDAGKSSKNFPEPIDERTVTAFVVEPSYSIMLSRITEEEFAKITISSKVKLKGYVQYFCIKFAKNKFSIHFYPATSEKIQINVQYNPQAKIW